MHCKLVELDASILCREGSAGLMVGTFVLKEEAALRKMQHSDLEGVKIQNKLFGPNFNAKN